jgi:N-acylglucosamine-6-phosphate 2-epimerase
VRLSNVSISNQPLTSDLARLKGGLVVSCQVPDGVAIDTPEFIAAQAETVVEAGAIGIRARGIENVAAISKRTTVPIIGLVKRYLASTPIYITPLVQDVLELEAAGASIVAIDATQRLRPNNLALESFIKEIRSHTSIPLLADVDTLEAGLIAEELGCESVATTLSGYTDEPAPQLPNVDLVRELAKHVKVPVIAEGGYSSPKQMNQAFDAGAWSVCVGTAITNPYLLTKGFISALD